MTASPVPEDTAPGQDLAARIERVFDAVPAALFDTVTTVDGLNTALAFFSGNTAEGEQDFATLADGAVTRLGKVGEALADLARRTDAVEARARVFRNFLADLDENLRTARFVSVNALVISRTIEDDGSLRQFAAEFQRRIGDIEAATAALRRDLDAADGEMAVVQEDFQDGAGLASDLGDIPRKLPEQIAWATTDQGMALLARDASIAFDILKSNLAQAITRLQVGDSVRQRLEHVAAIRARPETARPGREGAILRQLAAAQEAAAIETLQREVASVIRDLNRMRDAAGRIERRLGPLRDPGKSDAFGAIATNIQYLRARIERFAARCDGLKEVVGRLKKAYAVSSASAEQVAERATGMNLIGVNAMLASSRITRLGQARAMLEVSRQLQEIIGTTHTLATAVLREAKAQEEDAEALSRATEIGEMLRGGPELSALEEALGSVEVHAATIRQALSDNTVAAHLQDARHLLQRFLASQAAPPPDTVPRSVGTLPDALLPVIAAIRATYTMAEEREIHDRLFPGIAPATTETPEEVLDDIFF